MVEWLFSSGGHTHASDFETRERLSFWHGENRAYLEEVPILPGIWLYRGEATTRCRFSIEVDGGEAGHSRLILGTILSSRGIASLEGYREEPWRDGGHAYIMTPVQQKTRYDIDAERGWATVALRLEREALELIGDEPDLPELVVQALDRSRDDVLDIAGLPHAQRSVAQAILRPPFRGRMGRLFQQAKTLELMAAQFAAVEQPAALEHQAGSRELAKVRMARDRLLADLRDPPELDALAREVGLSAKRLNRGFKQLYGTTVFSFLRDARLDAAREALEAGTSLPLKQLAWELGYGQASNFVTAFRRRFGATPGVWKRGEDEI